VIAALEQPLERISSMAPKITHCQTRFEIFAELSLSTPSCTTLSRMRRYCRAGEKADIGAATKLDLEYGRECAVRRKQRRWRSTMRVSRSQAGPPTQDRRMRQRGVHRLVEDAAEQIPLFSK
jgi:hypothetical protein